MLKGHIKFFLVYQRKLRVARKKVEAFLVRRAEISFKKKSPTYADDFFSIEHHAAHYAHAFKL